MSKHYNDESQAYKPGANNLDWKLNLTQPNFIPIK